MPAVPRGRAISVDDVHGHARGACCTRVVCSAASSAKTHARASTRHGGNQVDAPHASPFNRNRAVAR
ncbi:hypothetical protein FCJ60_29505 [Burkholderia metallica]|nr:hypothetical protein [Burkholderia metallica]